MPLHDDFEQNMETFKSDGFVLIKNVVAQSDLEPYRRALLKAIEAQDSRWGDNEYYVDKGMVHNPMVNDPLFLDFLGNDIVHAYLEAALDKHCILYAFTTSSMPPLQSNFSNRVHVDCPRVIDNYITNVGFLVALNDFTPENGATYFLPKSAQRLDVPTEEEFFANAKRPLPKAGDAIMFNARTWHCGGQNKTENYRHALTMNVCRSYMKQRFDYPRMLGNSLLETRDERTLKFLGYRTRTPVNLEEYYVPPAQRLYLPGQG